MERRRDGWVQGQGIIVCLGCAASGITRADLQEGDWEGYGWELEEERGRAGESFAMMAV